MKGGEGGSKYVSNQILFFWGGGGPKSEVAQSVLKYILVLGFLKSDGNFENCLFL